MAGRSWLTVGPDQASLRLKVTPKAAKDALAGIATDAAGDQHLVVRVTAPAEAGKANRAVLKLLAKQLGLPVSQLAVTSGASARHKTVTIAGSAPTWLDRLRKIAQA